MSDVIKIPAEELVLDAQSIAKATEWEEFVSLWTTSQQIDKSNQWYKGDIADRVAVIHGEASLKQFAEEVKESHVTIGHYRRVSRAFPDNEMRQWNLSWTHYFIASLSDSYNKGAKKFDTDNRFKWLEDAHDNNWTTTHLEKEIKKANAIKDDKDYFEYYENQIKGFGNFLLHQKFNTLSDEEKKKLYNQLSQILTDFAMLLKQS